MKMMIIMINKENIGKCLTINCNITINQCLTIGEVMGEEAGYCCECSHDEFYGDQYWCDDCKKIN